MKIIMVCTSSEHSEKRIYRNRFEILNCRCTKFQMWMNYPAVPGKCYSLFLKGLFPTASSTGHDVVVDDFDMVSIHEQNNIINLKGVSTQEELELLNKEQLQ